jgi:hypothetical protein
MWLIIIFLLFLSFWRKFKPEIEYIEDSRMWICHYNKGKRSNISRDWFIIFKE